MSAVPYKLVAESRGSADTHRVHSPPQHNDIPEASPAIAAYVKALKVSYSDFIAGLLRTQWHDRQESALE